MLITGIRQKDNEKYLSQELFEVAATKIIAHAIPIDERLSEALEEEIQGTKVRGAWRPSKRSNSTPVICSMELVSQRNNACAPSCISHTFSGAVAGTATPRDVRNLDTCGFPQPCQSKSQLLLDFSPLLGHHPLDGYCITNFPD
ncbi:hypothetical protein TNCV_3652741 [Trichonephila clavipes]|nr:hypothetical protein TNCV_3652741 [Trichonephila clavipes]